MTFGRLHDTSYKTAKSISSEHRIGAILVLGCCIEKKSIEMYQIDTRLNIAHLEVALKLNDFPVKWVSVIRW